MDNSRSHIFKDFDHICYLIQTEHFCPFSNLFFIPVFVCTKATGIKRIFPNTHYCFTEIINRWRNGSKIYVINLTASFRIACDSFGKFKYIV